MQFRTLRFRLLAISFGLLLMFGSGVLFNGYRIIIHAMQDSLRVSVAQTSEILNLAISPYAVSDDLKKFRVFVAEMVLSEEVKDGLIYVAVGRRSGEMIFVAGDYGGGELPKPDETGDIEAAAERGMVHVRRPLLLANSEIGFMQYGLSSRMLALATRQSLVQGAMLVAIGLLIGTVLIIYFSNWLSRRIVSLTAGSSAIAQGNYDTVVPEDGNDEIALLAHHFNSMAVAIRHRILALEESRAEIARLNEGLEQRVLERTAELGMVNDKLQETIDHLKQTQLSLVQSEKLASLGSLVAGIAHELNTPLGSALTVSTTLEARTSEFVASLETGIKRSMLTRYTEVIQESCHLINRNLERAAELITSFKHVAVDQTSSHRREFDLSVVVKEVIDTLEHTFRKTPYELTADIPPGIVLDSYPGPLGQVVTNFINNALIHAFEGRERGQMTISAQVREKRVVMIFSDDGNGIAPEYLKRIFDPFFTTRLGQGGSGLGLNIVFTIVEGLLGGQIQVESSPGAGTRFILDLPLVAPVAANAVEAGVAD